MNKSRLLALSILLLGAPVSAAMSEPPQVVKREKIESLRRKAVESYRKGDYDQAIRDYRAWSELEPGSPLVLKDLMWALWNQQRFDEASDAARRVLQLRPNDRDAVELLAMLPTAAGRAQLQVLYKQAMEFLNRGDAAGAAPLYRRLMALDPADAAMAKQLLSCLRRLHLYEEGAQVADHLVKIHPEDAENWYWLGQMQAGLEHEDLAMQAYQKSLQLQPDQPRVSLALGALYLNQRDFDHAVSILSSIQGDEETMMRVHALLAKAEYWKRDYAKASADWARAGQAFPERPEYGLYEAQAAFYEMQEAHNKLKATVALHPESKAVEFLADERIMAGDIPGAERILEGGLIAMTPAEEGRAMKLAELYQKNGDPVRWGIVVDRLLTILPNNLNALQMKGSQLAATGDCEAALTVFRKMRELNPYSNPALLGISDCEMNLGHPSAALEAMRALREYSPANPFFMFKEARLLNDTGRRRQARRELDRWLDDNRGSQVLPALLYHGLTPFARDPLLAYPYHMTVAQFGDQMRALRDSGYHPVTAAQVAAWYSEGKPLPEKPVFISFDDGRLDSLQHGDPVLAKYGLRATMFAALVNMINPYNPGYASWNIMRGYQDNGRWDIQSHGKNAHIYITISSSGARGLFLINRQWLDADQRLETLEEWKERIDNDHQESKKLIKENLGRLPVAYAFPEGYYGQQGASNDPHAALINLYALREAFKLGFVQDEFGMNVRSDDPAVLHRLIPDNTWSGQELLNHLEANDPFNRLYKQRADWAIAGNRLHEAEFWTDEMDRNGLAPGPLLVERAQIAAAGGDFPQALDLAQGALSWGDSPEVRGLISTITVQSALGAESEYAYDRDSDHRQHWVFDQTLQFLPMGRAIWGLRYERGEYMQTGVPAAVDNAGGISLDFPLTFYQHFSGEVLKHSFSGDARPAKQISGSGTLQSAWTDDFQTQLEGGRGLYNTVLAVNNNILASYGRLFARLSGEDSPWRVSGSGRFARLSDTNRRVTTWGEIARDLTPNGLMKGVYRFTYDDMRFISPDYYSPQRVRMHGAGPELKYDCGRVFNLTARYLASYAREGGQKDALEHNVEASLLWHLGLRGSINLSYEYYNAPSYVDNHYAASAQYRF